MGADEYNWFGGRCTSAAEAKHAVKMKEAGYSSHFQGLSKKTYQGIWEFLHIHKKKKLG